jgi:hypothetical protein
MAKPSKTKRLDLTLGAWETDTKNKKNDRKKSVQWQLWTKTA